VHPQLPHQVATRRRHLLRATSPALERVQIFRLQHLKSESSRTLPARPVAARDGEDVELTQEKKPSGPCLRASGELPVKIAAAVRNLSAAPNELPVANRRIRPP